MSDCLRRHNNKTIICLSHLAWDMALFQRPHQLMSCFDEMDYTVLYVGCTGTKAKKRLTANGKFGNHGVYVNLDYSPFANPIVRYVRHKEVLAQAQSLTMNEENNTVLWITQPLLGSFTSSIRHTKIVFDAMDPYLNFEKHTNRLEDSISQLCSEADLVFAGANRCTKTSCMTILTSKGSAIVFRPESTGNTLRNRHSRTLRFILVSHTCPNRFGGILARLMRGLIFPSLMPFAQPIRAVLSFWLAQSFTVTFAKKKHNSHRICF